MPDADGMHCELITDPETGEIIASVRVSDCLSERGREALLEVIAAARRLQAEEDAADPSRAERQEAAIRRIRERRERLLGGDAG